MRETQGALARFVVSAKHNYLDVVCHGYTWCTMKTMKIMKIRRSGNSNVVALPHDLENLGYVPGVSVLVEALPSGELRIIPAAHLQDLIRETGRRVIAENREALDILAAHDHGVDSAAAEA